MDTDQQAAATTGFAPGLGPNIDRSGPPPEAPAMVSPPLPGRHRSLLVTAAVVAATLAGGTVGFVVGDDADEVADLEEQVAEGSDTVADLEGDLEEEQERRADQEDVLDECHQAAEATATLVADVEALEDSYDAYMAAPIGSDEELQSWLLLGEALIEVFGTSSAADQSAGTCLVEAAE